MVSGSTGSISVSARQLPRLRSVASGLSTGSFGRLWFFRVLGRPQRVHHLRVPGLVGICQVFYNIGVFCAEVMVFGDI